MSEDKELWMTRAAACELLALSLRYPTDELARILTSASGRMRLERLPRL